MKALEPKHTKAQHASLAAKKTKAERQLSAGKAKDDLEGYYARQQASAPRERAFFGGGVDICREF